MISFLRGTIVDIEIDSIVLEVSGIGYRVFLSARNIANIGNISDKVLINTYLNVREDAITLFGFKDKIELEVFNRLITVKGIGPKVGLAILSSLEASAIIKAIVSSDELSLTKAQGVGKKTAQRIILELKDKFDEFSILDSLNLDEGQVQIDVDVKQEAIDALMSLGYARAEAVNAVYAVKTDLDDLRTEDLIKLALKNVSI